MPNHDKESAHFSQHYRNLSLGNILVNFQSLTAFSFRRLSVILGISILHMLLHLSESEGMDSVRLEVPASVYIYSPYILMGWLLLLVLGKIM